MRPSSFDLPGSSGGGGGLRGRAVRSGVVSVLVLTAVIVGIGCGMGTPPRPAGAPLHPCVGSETTVVELGSPYPRREESPARPATFTTDGSPIYLLLHDQLHGGVFDPDRWTTSVTIGPLGTEPVGRGVSMPPSVTELRVLEDEYHKVRLPAGSYWLLSSNGGPLQILSCTPGALVATAAPRWTRPTRPKSSSAVTR